LVSFCIYAIFIISFFGNFFSGYNLAPDYINWLTEPLIYSLLLYSISIKKGNIKLPFITFILFFLLAGFFSSIVNKNLSVYSLLSVRNVLRFYLFYLAIVNLSFEEIQLKKINYFLVWVFIIQIPVATIKLFFYGQGERAIGTYSMTDGSLSTIIPMIAISFLLGYYILYNKNFVFIFLMMAFIYYSIIGGKRAFIFMLPLLLIFVYYMMMVKGKWGKRQKSFSGIKGIIYIPIIIIIVGYFCLKFIPTLNPEKETGGSINPNYAIDYAIKSTKGTSSEDFRITTGRWATTKRIYTTLYNKGLDKLIFGLGPGETIKSRFRDRSYREKVLSEFKIGYGITSLGFILMEFGIIGTVIFIFLICYILFYSFKYFMCKHEPYWEAFSFGTAAMCFCMVVWFFSYSTTAFFADTIPCFFYYCLGVVNNHGIES